MDLLKTIYEYDSTLINKDAKSGKYYMCLLVRGKPKYSILDNDLRGGIRLLFNLLLLELDERHVFITLEKHSMGYIVCRSTKFKRDYYLQITHHQPTVSEIASYLK